MTETATRDMLKAALAYADLGWYVLPLHEPLFDDDGQCIGCTCESWKRSQPKYGPDYVCGTPGKHPRIGDWETKATCDPEQIRRWWAQWPTANVGIAAGKAGMVAVDLDTYHAAAEGGASLDLADRETVTNLTGGGGEHLIYAHPAEGPKISNSDRSLPEWVNIRAHGGQFVAPPSLHPSGRRYAWEVDYSPLDREPAPLPAALAELLQSEATKPAPAVPAGPIPAGKRHPTLVSLAGTMRRRGMSEPAILAALLAENERCEPPKPAAEVRDIAAWAAKQEPEDPVLSANGQGPAGQDDEPAKGWTVALAEHICKSEHFAMSEGGELHYYDGGRYVPNGKRRVRRKVKKTLVAWGREDVFTSYRANEVTAYIAADAPLLWTQPPAGRLNVANGILDLHTRTLQEHTAKWLSTLQLPVAYDPDATVGQWERFIADWFPADAQETPWELLAWLISPSLSLQKAGLLLGNGANGKSRFLAAVKAFLGPRNVAALSLAQIETSRWATHHLNGKLANICPDLPAQHLETSSMFKALTGGDTVPAEKKHGDMYEYRPFARLLFSANQPPQSKDASRAFFRRWIVIPFDATFAPEERLPEAEIDELLSAPVQLSGALNRALDALPAVQREGITETESMRDAHREFHEVTDPIEVWLETNTVERPSAYVVKGDLAKAYNEAAREKGWPVLTASQFGRRVKDWRPGLEDGQKRVAGSRPTVWYGLGLKVDDER